MPAHSRSQWFLLFLVIYSICFNIIWPLLGYCLVFPHKSYMWSLFLFPSIPLRVGTIIMPNLQRKRLKFRKVLFLSLASHKTVKSDRAEFQTWVTVWVWTPKLDFWFFRSFLPSLCSKMGNRKEFWRIRGNCPSRIHTVVLSPGFLLLLGVCVCEAVKRVSLAPSPKSSSH